MDSTVVQGIQGVEFEAGPYTAGNIVVVVDGAFSVLPLSAVISETTPPVGGDLLGTLPNPEVVGWQGVPLNTAAPAHGEWVQYNAVTDQWSKRNPPYFDITLATNEWYTFADVGSEITIGGMRLENLQEFDYMSLYVCGVINPAEEGNCEARLYYIPPADEDPEVLIASVIFDGSRFDFSDTLIDLDAYYNTSINVELRVFVSVSEGADAHLLKAGIRVEVGGRNPEA